MTSTPTDESAPRLVAYRCTECAAAILYNLDSLSAECPYCGTRYAVEETPSAERRTPEGLIEFELTPADVRTFLDEWLSSGFFTPRKLRREAELRELQALYVPVWVFDVVAESQWTAEAGFLEWVKVPYRTTVNGRRVVRVRHQQRTRWEPASGSHSGDWPRVPVPSSPGLAHFAAQFRAGASGVARSFVEGFDYAEQRSFHSQFLLGVAADASPIALDDARELMRERVSEHERRACSQMVPGDSYRALRVNTRVASERARLVYVPAYIATVHYRGRPYCFAVNGQTGTVRSDAKPVSVAKVLLVMLIVLAVAIALGTIAGSS